MYYTLLVVVQRTDFADACLVQLADELSTEEILTHSIGTSSPVAGGGRCLSDRSSIGLTAGSRQAARPHDAGYGRS